MNAKIYTRLISALLLCYTSLSLADSLIMDNRYNLNSESSLSHNYNKKILSFWEENAKSSYFQGVDNNRIHTISLLNGNQKAIVISQGRNESVFKYKEVAYDLASQGYDLFLIDHRGQGLSERFGGDQFRGHVEKFQDYIEDLNHYVSTLELDKKYQNRYLLSHSMGGAISALYLEQNRHPFQAAVFFSPMLSINLGAIPHFLAKAITASSASVCGWFSDTACYSPGGGPYEVKAFEGNDLTSSQARFHSSQHDFNARPATQLGSPSMRWVANSITATEKAIENAHKITIPLLILQAGSDTVVSAEGQKAFFDNLTYCKFNQLLIIADAKHEILLERDALRTTALNNTLKFLTDTTQGSHSCIK